MFTLEESLIDWKGLQVQKMYLRHLTSNPKLTHNEQIALDALVNFLDYVQDQAVGVVAESTVFTYCNLSRMATNMSLPYKDVDDAPFVIIDADGNWLDACMTRPDAESIVRFLTSAYAFEDLDVITRKEWKVRLHGTEIDK